MMTCKSAVRQLWCSSLVVVFGLAMTAANARAFSFLDGLWHMDGSAVTVADSSGNGNTGAGTNTVLTAGKFSNSLHFNGSSAFVLVNDSPTVQETGSFTLEAWIWVDPASDFSDYQMIALKWDSDNDLPTPLQHGYLFAINKGSGNLVGAISQNGDNYDPVFGATTITKGRWHHVAMVYVQGTGICPSGPYCAGPSGSLLPVPGPSTLTVYLDGVADKSAYVPETAIFAAPGVPFLIGAQNFVSASYPSGPVYGQFFDGNIDEVRLWGRALGAGEILASAQSGLRGDWHFDTVNTTTQVTPDSSGYSNNATLGGIAFSGTPIAPPEPWFGQALQLNGANYASVPDNLTYPNSTVDIKGSLTLDAWINPTILAPGAPLTVGPATQVIAGRGGKVTFEVGPVTPTPAPGYVLFLSQSNTSPITTPTSVPLCMGYTSLASPVWCGGAVTLGWHHVAGVVDWSLLSPVIHLYVDGIEVTAEPTGYTFVPLTPPAPFIIGAEPNGSGGYTGFFSGAIDEVHLWAGALGGNEVAFLAGYCSGDPTKPLTLGCAAELVVPVDMTQKITSSDAEVFPETYFQYLATSGKGTGVNGPFEHAMPLWFMVTDPDSTKTTVTGLPVPGCALDLGSTPGTPLLGGLLGCQGSADGKSALISGDQIDVQTSAKKPKQPATTLHLDVTTSDSDELPVNVQWR